MLRLDLTNYSYPFEGFERVDGKVVQVNKEREKDVKSELYQILRLPGLFQNVEQVVEAVTIARNIRDCEEDSIDLTENDFKLVKTAFDKLISRTHDLAKGQVALGGPEYEELILRVASAEKV